MSRIKTVILTFSSTALSVVAHAQAPNIKWQNTIGGTNSDYIESVDRVREGGYILGGRSWSDISGDKTQNAIGYEDYWIVKIDNNGNVLWDRTFGGDTADYCKAIRETSDKGFIVGGFSNSNISGDKTENANGYDYWILKLDSLGNIMWQNTIGGNGTDWLYSVRPTADGGYILGGYSDSDSSSDKSENSMGGFDYWVVKVDETGNIEWDNTIGGSQVDYLFSIEQTTDLGYILGGYSNSNISGDKTESAANFDYWIVKLDSVGNIQWQNTIGGSAVDAGTDVKQSIDGGYFVGGWSHSNISGDKTENSNGVQDYWVLKTDSMGNIIYQNTIGGTDYDMLRTVEATSDGGCLLGGYSNSQKTGDKSEYRVGYYDMWVVKLNPLCEIEWENTIGGTDFEAVYGIMQDVDGGYILGGFSSSDSTADKTEDAIGGADFWVLKLCAEVKIQLQDTLFCLADPAMTLLGHPTGGMFIGAGIVGSTFNASMAGVGTHQVIYEYNDSSSCWGSDTIYLHVDSCTIPGQVNDPSQLSAINISPNPSNGKFLVTGTLKNSKISVYNALGQCILKTIAEDQYTMLDMSAELAGIYFIEIKNQYRISREKIIKHN